MTGQGPTASRIGRANNWHRDYTRTEDDGRRLHWSSSSAADRERRTQRQNTDESVMSVVADTNALTLCYTVLSRDCNLQVAYCSCSV